MTGDLYTRIAAGLQAYEPDYRFLATYGDAALPIIDELLTGNDPELASRALLLAIEIGGAESARRVRDHVADSRVEVRAVIAARADHLNQELTIIALDRLLQDSAASIRRLAASAAGRTKAKALLGRLQTVSAGDSESAVRSAADAAIKATGE